MQALRVTLIQTHLYWEDPARNREALTRKIRSSGNTELVILPEMFSTGFSMRPAQLAETMEGPTVNWMRQTAADLKIILTGSLIISESGKYYNRLVWALPNGQLGTYDKRHLFAFAGEDEQYTAGSKRLIASVNGWKINLQICYDLRFPVWSRQALTESEMREPEYDLLVYVANWPEKRSLAWRTLLQARAIENQCYVIGVNRTGSDDNGIVYNGDSMLIGPLGEILYHQAGKEDVFTTALNRETLEEARLKFPFWRDRDRFLIEP